MGLDHNIGYSVGGLNEVKPNNLSVLGFVPQPNLPKIRMA